MARYVYETQNQSRLDLKTGESEINGDPATPFLFPPVCVSARQGPHQRCLSVVDVTTRANDDVLCFHSHRIVCSNVARTLSEAMVLVQSAWRHRHLLLMCPLLAASLFLAATALSQTIEIVNEYGGVSVEVVAGPYVKAWRSGGDPDVPEGIALRRSPNRLVIEALAPEAESPDIDVEVPLGYGVSVETKAGDVVLTGMMRRTHVRSLEGSLTVIAPLETVAMRIQAHSRPQEFSVPPGRRLALVPYAISPRLRIWSLSNNSNLQGEAYGLIEAELYSPRALTVNDWPFPKDWPLKPHSHGKAAVERLLAKANRRRKGNQEEPDLRRPGTTTTEFPGESTGDAVFTADVRMVSMSVAVSDSGGRPLAGLTREDFGVAEDGRAQEIRVATEEESPFNLAILLDLSGSTSVDLDYMRQATLRLIGIAGPNDRVALYAMAGSLFHRLAPLSSDKEDLAARGNSLPYPAGGSPLWDTIALAYDDELADRAGERNALIVISDGIDNRISGHSTPSTLRSRRLIEAAGEMDARIYPILLLSGERFGRNWSLHARQRMEALARKTGGRLFTAHSIADIEPVIPKLVEELRSVYGVAYYPTNQVFDGSWRRVRVKVDLPGAQIRARPGYFAE